MQAWRAAFGPPLRICGGFQPLRDAVALAARSSRQANPDPVSLDANSNVADVEVVEIGLAWAVH